MTDGSLAREEFAGSLLVREAAKWGDGKRSGAAARRKSRYAYNVEMR
jgi:hypothetical protein